MADAAEEQRENNGKRLGGCTGKGFMPGQSGNPGGRPKGSSLVARIRRLLDEEEGAADAIVRAGVEAAKNGDFKFWNAIVEQMDGRPKQLTELTGKDGEPLFKSYVGVDVDKV